MQGTRVANSLKTTIVVALLAALAPHASGDELPVASPKPPPPGGTAPGHRQFDFWLGEWMVRDAAGKVVGENRITSQHKGCALLENWTGAGGFTGTSLNIYDAERKKWHQTWVDVGGGLLLLDGGVVDGAMVLTGESPAPDAPGKTSLQRITWTPLPDGRVRQLWESSNDAGKTWTVAFDGYYTKAK
jgi:hypothetical protein